MAKIKDFREIPLEDLEIGTGQARTRNVGSGIDELAESIDKQGLLEPIVVCPGSQKGKYEILTGQRRFLAHKELNRPTIWAAVLDEKVDEVAAKVISVTENLVREDLNQRDLIDACTFLYKKYGNMKLVSAETGLPYQDVIKYVKYDQLIPELRGLVDDGAVRLDTALRAQRAASQISDDFGTEAVAIAKEMSQMTHAQQKQVVNTIEKSSDKPFEDAIEAAKQSAKITQIVVVLGDEIHERLQRYADDEGATQNDAAAGLIEEALQSKGYVD